ncbi:oligosaccharide flippase family protein [Pseudonocardia sp. CA-107938]|uniref:oligosaccharide flippase family protein n=1 Tax=Pseudonocardia sp. CA-107938 TaxID=3240021 RepID=UPI003D8FA35F
MTAPADTEKRPGGKRPRGWRERARISTEKATSPPDMEGLNSTLKRGATYSAIALLFGQLVSFVQTLILARLFGPDDMGIYVAGALLSGFLISVSEGGLRGALIQRENDVPRAANTVFWATGGTGVLLALVALGTAPIVGMVSGFANPDFVSTVTAIAAANSGVMIIHALTNVPDGLMQRQFNFRRRLIVDPARMLVFAVVSIAFAAMHYGPWAQVIGNYAAMLTWLVLSWWFAGWWPGFAKPSYRMWREMAKFAFPLMLEGLVEKVRTGIETVLIGHGLDADGVGNYRYGQRLSLIPGNAVVQIGSYVLFPAFARLASDPDRLRNAFLRGLQWAWIASVAVAGLVVAIGEPAVVVLLGEKWRGAGLAFVALAAFGPGIALQAAGSEAIKATGRSQLLNWTTATSVVLGLGLLFVLMPPLGLVGVGLAASVTELAVGAVILLLTYKVIPYSVPTMLRTLVPPLVIAAIAGAVTGFVEHAVLHADRFVADGGVVGHLLAVLALIGESLLFMVIFLAGMALVEPKLARRAVKAVKSKLRRGGEDEEDEEDEEDDGIERRDPMLDPPTMFLPTFRADETMEFGRRPIRDWGSPTAQTMIMPIIRPAQPRRPSPVAAETTKLPARVAEADAAVDRAEDAIISGERIPPASPMAPVDGPTELAIPARRPASGRPAPGGRSGPPSVPPMPVPVPPGPVPPGPAPTRDSASSLPPGGVPLYDARADAGLRRPPGPGPSGAPPAGPRPAGPPRPGPQAARPEPGPPRPGRPRPAEPAPGPRPFPPAGRPAGPVPPGDGDPGPRPVPQGPPGRPYGPPRNGAPNGAPRNGAQGGGPVPPPGRHSPRQAPPNGGRGPRPPTPPRGVPGQPLPRPVPPPMPPQSPPAGQPVPRRHRYLDDSGPQPVNEEPRRHRYIEDDDARPDDRR